MTRLRTLVLILMTTLGAMLAEAAQAGWHITGNGGKGVACPQDRSVRLLDYYEAVERGFVLDLGSDELAPYEKVDLILARVRLLDEALSDRYERIFEMLKSRTTMPDRVDLMDTGDASTVYLPTGCRLVQLAVQKVPEYEEDPIFFFSQSQWNRLNVDHRAGLLLHEIVFYDALRHGHETSRDARYFTGLISSTKLLQLTASEFQTKLRELNLREIVWNDTVSGERYLLIDQLFTAFAGASAACEQLGGRDMFGACDRNCVRNFGSRIRDSYIGKYFISALAPLEFWVPPTPQSPRPYDIEPAILAIEMTDASLKWPRASEGYRAFCRL